VAVLLFFAFLFFEFEVWKFKGLFLFPAVFWRFRVVFQRAVKKKRRPRRSPMVPDDKKN
jgi:hypothetical protein